MNLFFEPISLIQRADECSNNYTPYTYYAYFEDGGEMEIVAYPVGNYTTDSKPEVQLYFLLKESDDATVLKLSQPISNMDILAEADDMEKNWIDACGDSCKINTAALFIRGCVSIFALASNNANNRAIAIGELHQGG